MYNISILLLFISFFLSDIYTNSIDGVAMRHIYHEMILCVFALALLTWHIISLFKSKKRLQSLERELIETKESYQQWKNKTHETSHNLRKMIDQQLEEWELSASEKDISLLLIKGLSMKEIAHMRETQEKTVRQQAAMIYKKSGLSGRQELSAFFLEDILSLNLA